MADTNPIIFRTYQTYGGYYVYDRHTNSVITLKPDEFQELQAVEKGEMSPEQSDVIARYQKEGLFVPNVVQGLIHPQTDILEYRSERRLGQLILQVTQQCNLRCSYCTYSGIYEGNRTHSSNRMNFETAKKAIDFFFDHNIDSAKVPVGFYGGEPLLEFDLIVQCVEYIEEKMEGKDIQFGLTTNGTLLQGERARFLVEHNFDISISLDGSQKEHDACRKFPDGSGSFELVIRHVEEMFERYPKYTKEKVKFFTTVNPYMDLGCVLNYFDSSELIDRSALLYNTMVPVNLKDEASYQESYYLIRNYEYVRMLFALVGKLEETYINRLVASDANQIARLWKAVHSKRFLKPFAFQAGPCMPGILRLFVRYDGGFYPCERVNENLEYYKIGCVEEGFYLERMKNLLNIGKLTEEECKICWNLRCCVMCSSEIELHGKEQPDKTDKLEVCKNHKKETEFELYQLCVLKEFGYHPKTEVLWI